MKSIIFIILFIFLTAINSLASDVSEEPLTWTTGTAGKIIPMYGNEIDDLKKEIETLKKKFAICEEVKTVIMEIITKSSYSLWHANGISFDPCNLKTGKPYYFLWDDNEVCTPYMDMDENLYITDPELVKYLKFYEEKINDKKD